MKSRIDRAEAAVAALLTIGAIWLQGVAAASAGPLWRDEANTVALATMPTMSEVWRNLQFDSFPLLWIGIIRVYSGIVGPSNDAAYRALGFAVGVGVTAALWIVARSINRSPPLVSLVLFGLCPSFILWGPSARAYGFGILLIFLTVALLWRFTREPTPLRWAIAGLFALAAVQTLYYNAVLLLAFGVGAIAVCWTRRKWSAAAGVVAIGATAAISLVAYVSVIRDAATWNALVQIPDYSLGWFLKMLDQTLRPGGSWVPLIWAEAFILAIVVGARAFRSGSGDTFTRERRDAVLFSLVALVTGSVGLFGFLNLLSYYTAPWYYLPLLALAAVCIDALSGALVVTPTARAFRLASVVVLGAATLVPATRAVNTRRSNVDVIASQLRERAIAGDAVFVHVWYYGVSLERYYRGSVPWTTIPPIDSHALHRYDLIKTWMTAADQRTPVRSVIDLAAASLQRGGKVFIVGDLPRPRGTGLPRVLPPAPVPGLGWPEQGYNDQWGEMVGHYLRSHAATITAIPVSPEGRVSQYENLRLLVAEGWRP